MRLLIALAVALLSSPAHASLIISDYTSTGDSLIIQDTNSGLEWLGFRATAGTSLNGAFTNLYGDRWAHASKSQICELWTGNGFWSPLTSQDCITAQGTTVHSNGDQWLQEFQYVFGYFVGPGGGAVTQGVFIAADGTYHTATVSTGSLPQANTDFGEGIIGDYDSPSTGGHWLVRPIPEPSSVVLFALGLGLAGLAVRRRLSGAEGLGR